jgi:hypothetical protein
VDLAGGGFVTTGTLRLILDGSAGNDTIAVASDLAATSTPTIDALVHGGAGADNLSVTLNNLGDNLPANYGPGAAVLIDGGYFTTDVCTVFGNPILHKRSCEL